jgi:surfactin synthase thioesterase subunit
VSTWLQRLAPRPDAARRLFCFHHAGGSAAAFRLWPARLPEFDVCAIQLPGRANRLAEPALTDVHAVVDALIDVVRPLLDRPFVLFGHSMGTLVACELARRLQVLGEPLPERLFVSGRQPPHRPFPDWSMDGLSDAQVLDAVQHHFGKLPAEVLQTPELLELVMPTLRADLVLLERHRPEAIVPLTVPIVALGGDGDTWATPERLSHWQACTTRPLRMHQFGGGHFYLDERLDEVLAVLRAECAEAAASAMAGDLA